MSQKLSVLLVLTTVIGLPAHLWAQQSAITADGQRVLLNADGTWEVVQSTVTDSIPGIRGVTWGMSQDDVKQSEEMTPADDYPDWLTYRVRVAGLPAVLEYSFDGDKLVSARYGIQDACTNKTEYITDTTS